MIFVLNIYDLLKIHNQLICESLSDVDSVNISCKSSMYQTLYKVRSHIVTYLISFSFLVTLTDVIVYIL